MSAPPMNKMYESLVRLQVNIVARLSAVDTNIPAPVPTNGSVTYLYEAQGDLASKLAIALNNIGLGVVVLTPSALMLDPENANSLEITAQVLIQVQENGIINRGANGTQIPALRLATFIMARLQGWPHLVHDGAPETQRVTLDRKPFVLVHEENPTIYNVACSAPLDLSLSPALDAIDVVP